MVTSILNKPAQQSPVVAASRLLVTRQDDTRLYRSIGFLGFEDGEYTFQYLKDFVESEWFSPLPGMTDVRKRYSSSQLFPLFAERVISARRPDRTESLKALGLPTEAAPFEVLTRTGGRRVGDTIQLVPMPVIAEDNAFTHLFLVHGVRYRPEEAQSRISSLKKGDKLRLAADPENTVNPLAVEVEDLEELTLGFVPDPHAVFVQEVLADTRGYKLTVEQANGPEVGFHFRLLVRLEGYSRSGIQPYTGSNWEFYS